jgi:hypothetical protein
MKKEIPNSIKITAMIIGTVVFLAIIIAYLIVWFAPTQTVSVSGESVLSVTPDVVAIYFMAETKGDSLEEAKDANAKVVEDLKKNLEELGVDRNSITTSNYNVGEDYEWANNRRVFKGYKATHNLKVELGANKTGLIGDVVGSAIDAGAALNYINFELSPTLQNQYKAEATLLASKDARGRAEKMAEGLGEKLGRVVSVSENNFGYYPWMAYDAMASSYVGNDAMEVKQAVTEITPGDQEIRSTVTVVYKLR